MASGTAAHGRNMISEPSWVGLAVVHCYPCDELSDWYGI
jgi:hypothetical protein